MAQALNNFLASKMNKDKDARLIPPGEYREGRNINISKSEGADVGALENVLGNTNITTLLINELQTQVGVNNSLEVIGLFKHNETSSLYVFITTYSDTSSNNLQNHGGGFSCFNYICKITLIEEVYNYTILVSGKWLNFSTTHPITGFNIIENLMFWTDNRNQPRKINIKTAEANPGNSANPWYCKEDQVSVATYAPIDPIMLVKNTGTDWSSASAIFEPTCKDQNSEYLPIHLTAPFTDYIGDGTTTPYGLDFSTDLTDATKPRWVGRGASPTAPNSLKNYAGKVGANDYPQIRLINLDNPNQGSCLIYETGDSTTGNSVYASDPNDITVLNNTDLQALLGWTEGDLIGFQLKNPDYDATFSGDKEYLKDKFVRFSYRFKYADNEYSLMAPFTQPVFIPGNWGNFTYLDETRAAESTELGFFENLLTTAELNIILPKVEPTTGFPSPTIKDVPRAFNLKEIEILIKISNDNNVYSVDSIEVTPENIESFLVQNAATSGTYISKYPLHSQFLYTYKANKPFRVLPERDITRVSDSTPIRALSQEVGANRVMYGNYLNKHAAPTSLNYQCLINPKTSGYDVTAHPPISEDDNTVVKEYYNNTLKQGRTYQVGVVLADRYGRQSSVILADNKSPGGLSSADNSTVVAPYSDTGSLSTLSTWFGNSLKVLFNSEIPSGLDIPYYPGLYSTLNPLGWYSYKIVVKQQQQEYYNVYLPGSLSGNVVFTDEDTELSYNGIYTTSNMSLFGDNINKIPRELDTVGPTDRIYGSSASLYFRVTDPIYDSFNKFYSTQFTLPEQFSVSSIQPWYDFAPWANQKGKSVAYPGGTGTTNGTIDPIFNADRNPFVATIDHASQRGRRLGYASNLQAAGANSKFSTNLIVAETKPVESNLDIFWETSTSGLISDLNLAIASGANVNAPKDLSTFNFSMQEKYPYDKVGISGSGDYLLDPNITVVTQAGAVTTDTNYTIELMNAQSEINGNYADITQFFELEKITTTTPHTYNLYLSQQGQYYNLNETGLIWNGELSFQFKLTTNDTVAGTAYPPLIVKRGNNFLSNNVPEWTSAKDPSPDPIETSIPADKEKFCFSLTGAKNPHKNAPMWDKQGSFWYVDQTGVSDRNDIITNNHISNFSFEDVTDFANGSYSDIASGCKPTIGKIEFATFDKNNVQLYPSSGYEELKINQTNPVDNSGYPFGAVESNDGIVTEYPFKFVQSTSGYTLLINSNIPPWVPKGYNKPKGGNDRFWPEGDLDGNDYCLYKIHVIVRENFPLDPASRLQTGIDEKIFYVRLNR